MIKKHILNYRKMSFESRTAFTTRFSLLSNIFLAIAKWVLAIFNGFFFFVAGSINIFIFIAKLFCYLQIKHDKKDNKIINNFIALSLMLAGILYSVYMGRLIYSNASVMNYSIILGITVALVSFIELGLAIKGIIKGSRKSLFYRNIKLISLCQAATAIVLTEVAIMSFTTDYNSSRVTNGIFGIVDVIFIILISIIIFMSPKLSIIGKEKRCYIEKNKSDETKSIEVLLLKSFWYGDYLYKGKLGNGKIEGTICKQKWKFNSLNIYIKILLLVLSEILIFVYFIGYIIYKIKEMFIINKLDTYMKDNGYLLK